MDLALSPDIAALVQPVSVTAPAPATTDVMPEAYWDAQRARGVLQKAPSASAEEVIASEDPFGREIIQHESGGNPLIGWKNTDLSQYPLDKFGFPDWPGKMGPAGRSYAAGLYGITKTNWHKYAPQVGVSDFSPESQQKVKNAILADQGPGAWTPYWRSGRLVPGGGLEEASRGLSEALGKVVNPLVPMQREPSATPLASVTPAPLDGGLSLEMLGLMAAGTHRFVPISGDPFKKAAAAALEVPMPEGLDVRTPDVRVEGAGEVRPAERPRVIPPSAPYVTKIGMRDFYEKYSPALGEGPY